MWSMILQAWEEVGGGKTSLTRSQVFPGAVPFQRIRVSGSQLDYHFPLIRVG